MLTEFGLPMTPEDSVAAFMGRGWTTVSEHVAREAGRPLPDDFHDRYLQAMFTAFETELAPVPGVARGARRDRPPELRRLERPDREDPLDARPHGAARAL